MTIATDIIAAEIIVEPTTGNIDLIVDQPVVIVDAPATIPVIVEVVGAPGPEGQPGPPGVPPEEADINLNVDYGNTAGAAGSYHTIIGAQASGGGAGAYVLGCRAIASGTYAGALGYGAYAAGNDSLALGRNTLAQLSGSVAIGTDDVGAGAQATVANQIVLGTAKHSLKVLGPATFSAAGTFVGYLTMGTGIQNNQPTAANHLTRKDYVDGKWTRWSGTQAQYDAIVTKDPNTLYVVV